MQPVRASGDDNVSRPEGHVGEELAVDLDPMVPSSASHLSLYHLRRATRGLLLNKPLFFRAGDRLVKKDNSPVSPPLPYSISLRQPSKNRNRLTASRVPSEGADAKSKVNTVDKQPQEH